MNRRHTRKIRRPPPVVDAPPRVDYLAERYNVFVEVGHVLFAYMTDNFESMLDGDTTIPDFEILEGIYGTFGYIDDIMEEHGADIQTQLIRWIREEAKSGDLFHPENWKPTTDPDAITSLAYVGYRNMFLYNQYYFQLGLVSSNYKVMNGNCTAGENSHRHISFCLGLFGWSDASSNKWLPRWILPLGPKNSITDRYWNLKS